ncbi:MAG: hypothetical protein A3I61_08215 [Acidobacteria bacterium RIFCSPLOWO2_02_FULL_68_18]|nr:MAG: hypothetical protein A3I61_08215 [Acidobacteria bacterium RIFCSPLOWO2_02_FULL_68_18]OFW51224.1 MAG: hypothetical protein A3G77_06310 [Acidobacteria bacterium RIFCSPLOWO2_12_FULL_68_19]
MAILTWLESSSLSTWVREGETIWAFPTILTLHTFGMGLLVGAGAVIDLRLLGIGRRLTVGALRPMFGVMWGGFWLNLVTGSMLFAADATRRGTDPLFMTKLVFVAIGVSVIGLIRRNVFDAQEETAAVPYEKTLAALSLVAWTAAVTMGRLLAYV